MATQRNPFQALVDRGKRRTLAEIEAATRGANPYNAIHNRAPRQTTRQARLSKWISDQRVLLAEEDLIVLDNPSPAQSSRCMSASARSRGNETTSQRPHSQAACPGALVRPSSTLPHTPPSSSRFPLDGLKRKASCLDDNDDDVIIVHPPPASSRRGSRTTTVIDLTKHNCPKRQSSFLGNHDDDVIIIDPPAAEMRRALRPLLLGTPKDGTIRPAKRPKQPNQQQTNLTSARRRGRCNAGPTAPKTNALSASATDATVVVANPAETGTEEVSVVLQSVESVTHLFTLATEIRDEIYRHLLVSTKPIHVQNLWTETARRPSRRGAGDDCANTTIDTRILSVCRQTAVEGTRILYSENCFLYLLRDEVSKGRRSQRFADSGRKINLAKYGHLIRHMAIELEPNRTEASYESLMADALATLAPGPTTGKITPDCSIHLHTLTVTVSPLLQASHRTLRGPGLGNQGMIVHEGRFLSVVSFFSRGAPVLKALQRINADFLRINVHVNSDIKTGTSSNESGDEADSESDGEVSDTASRRPKKRHLETTIDLRCLPRRMEALSREDPLGNLWANDALMQARRHDQGAKANNTLVNLRLHIEQACLEPEKALRGGVWEDHAAAERRRREKKAKEAARLDGDAWDVKDDRQGLDRWISRGMRSLIISIDRVGGELRAYRP
ncbi:uncharacterized protein THITE_2108470 [Thermothielavioides terrestris NRRL 8126]|uniref:Uncharacterized protein n=1 Tax=Thermothielavioides terrestris (strain ATCC 38088 / NRRL 8126) TaxID=578455 RepID=G2QRK6_THETT|nr:uncharacterized protein THITE_2108470 [Thermothielavioides terrestris NRRL 8126]AEO63353.1 hypothetical protein THITE_2108470 [Thermothielavioides terrestris NRRL 8126]